ncbi:alpha-1,2-mannosyltransferase [Paragonimus westermani]|uniref:GDP-Man:Man(3)GlcNAc(2)-PP-Dol alpha-1,2-mannosyltransferase n=1 Tax=Paragonimus westermani TaxID=34504 RepID=A0A5J4NFF4_9TREM|nr:alpha-1,2-mannosyltransferase [Paragonimus westermani]
MYFLTSFIFTSCILVATACLPWLFYWRRRHMRKCLAHHYGLSAESPKLIAFFHPYCTSGGGGERVLWSAIQAMLSESIPGIIVVYTHDPMCVEGRQQVFDNVRHVFGISLSTSQDKPTTVVHFVRLRSVKLLSPSLYPILTLAGQALGSILVGLEALARCPPDIYLDTTGFAFTLPLAKRIASCKTGAYVHYPMISSDMLDRICLTFNSETKPVQQLSYNHAQWIKQSRILSYFKYYYYRFMLIAYGWSGSPRNVDLVLVNSLWTYKHIRSLWGGKPLVLYPPCPLPKSSFTTEERLPWIMSIGQFRPEKNHELQLDAFRLFLKRLSLLEQPTYHNFRLLLIGGCRDAIDLDRVDQLKKLVGALGLTDVVQFHINISYEELLHRFRTCTINLHTMVDEHFGIGIVEGMAAGLITVAHNSGGPQTDIIGPAAAKIFSSADECGVGFLACTAEDYADAFEYVLTKMTEPCQKAMQQAARARACEKFSEDCFCRDWLQYIRDLLT